MSAAEGPISIIAWRPRLATARMPARKRTGSPMCRTQYSGVPISANRAGRPVRLETTVMVGSWKVMSFRAVRKSS